MSPEMPLVAAGIVSVGTGLAKNKKWTNTDTTSIIATLVLIVIAATAKNSKLGPVVNALAWLYLIAILIRAIPSLSTSSKTTTKKKVTKK